jgi:hypothetical protein
MLRSCSVAPVGVSSLPSVGDTTADSAAIFSVALAHRMSVLNLRLGLHQHPYGAAKSVQDF